MPFGKDQLLSFTTPSIIALANSIASSGIAITAKYAISQSSRLLKVSANLVCFYRTAQKPIADHMYLHSIRMLTMVKRGKSYLRFSTDWKARYRSFRPPLT